MTLFALAEPCCDTALSLVHQLPATSLLPDYSFHPLWPCTMSSSTIACLVLLALLLVALPARGVGQPSVAPNCAVGDFSLPVNAFPVPKNVAGSAPAVLVFLNVTHIVYRTPHRVIYTQSVDGVTWSHPAYHVLA